MKCETLISDVIKNSLTVPNNKLVYIVHAVNGVDFAMHKSSHLSLRVSINGGFDDVNLFLYRSYWSAKFANIFCPINLILGPDGSRYSRFE